MRKLVSLTLCLLMSCALYGQTPSAAVKPAAVAPSSPPAPDVLPDGTPVKLRISQTISSADAKVGQEVPFEVLEDLKVDGVVVLPKGSAAIGTVTEAVHKKSMGRAGKLNVNISYARLTDNQKVALRATKEARGGGHVGAMATAMVATSIVFFPAAPLFLFIHGKDITIPQGTEITSFVDGDMHLNMSDFAKTGASASPATASPAGPVESSLSVDSTPKGADIELDGAFVGNTPSTVKAPSGEHTILIHKDGYKDWSRKISITGGAIQIDASMTRATAN